MRVVLVEPSRDVRGEMVELLQGFGIAVVAFGDPRNAFFFLLGSEVEADGILVNGDDAARPSWLRRRLELLPAAPPLLIYSPRHPERKARIAGQAPAIGA